MTTPLTLGELYRLEELLEKGSATALALASVGALPALIAEIREMRAFRDEVKAYFEPHRPAGYPPFPETLLGMKFHLEEKFPAIFGGDGK